MPASKAMHYHRYYGDNAWIRYITGWIWIWKPKRLVVGANEASLIGYTENKHVTGEKMVI
jgi:hypothetical protein